MAPPSGMLSPTLSGLTFFWVHTDCLAERPCTLSLFLALPSLLRRWRSPLFSCSHPIPTTNGDTRSGSQIFPQLNPSFSSLSETVTFNHHLWARVRRLFTPWETAWPIPFLVYQTCADRLLSPKARVTQMPTGPQTLTSAPLWSPFSFSTKLSPPSPYFLGIPLYSSNLRSEARAKWAFSSPTLTVSTTATENMQAPHIRGTHHQPSASLLTNAEPPEVMSAPSRTITTSSAPLKTHQMTTQDWASSTS